MKNKCVFVLGPEKTGSQLIARICSHVLNVHKYGEWKGGGWSDKGRHKVYHRSLPYRKPPVFPDVEQLIFENEKDYDIYFILTTRDITISELSRLHRLAKPLEVSHDESAKAREIMSSVINSGQKYFIWSYETFMFLGKEYLDCLYHFLDVQSDFIPELVDANRKKTVRSSIAYVIWNEILKLGIKIKRRKDRSVINGNSRA